MDIFCQGNLKWRYLTTPGAGIESSPIIGSDGTIYIGGQDGYVYAITSSGCYKMLLDLLILFLLSSIICALEFVF